jgi:peptidyl-prolyl cis-trans isomerase D
LPAIILGIGVPFVAYFGFQGANQTGGPNPTGIAIRLGDRTTTSADLQRAVDTQLSRYRENLGEGFDEKAALPFIVAQAASGLLRTSLLAHTGESIGLSVSDQEVVSYIRSIPGALDEKGKLNREGLRDFAERQFGTERRFHQMLRDELLATKTARLIGESVVVSDAEAKDAIRFAREEVKLSLVKLDGSQPRADLEVPEEAGKALLAKDPERVRKAYEERKDQIDTPEQVRARHVLVSLPSGADDATKAAAQARLDAARGRIEAGEDFAVVAQEVSDDPGSKTKGGDLGFFSRGQMVRAFEDAAFALEPGKLSETVTTDFGLHLIRVEEKKAATQVPYGEASLRVAQELARTDAAASVARADAEALSAAIRAGKSLEDAATERKLTITRPGPLRRRADGYIEELGPAPAVLTAAFALTEEKPSDPTIHELPNNVFVLIQRLARTTPSEAEIDAALPLERENVLGERRLAVETAWLENQRKQLEESGDLVVDTSDVLPPSLRGEATGS